MIKAMRTLYRRIADTAAAAGAIALGIAATAVLLGYDRWEVVPVAIALHGAATWCALVAARGRRTRPLSVVERDLIVLAAATCPVFGPCIAWSFTRKDSAEGEKAPEVENAHEMFERYLEHVHPVAPRHERTLFTGDFAQDLARELDVESFAQVLRNGDIDQRQNAIRRLANLGEPRHVALIRDCLVDSEQEIQLAAYSELDRLSKEHEKRIYKAMAKLDDNARDVECIRDLAGAHFAYGRSGILDRPSSAYHLKMAVDQAELAQRLGDTAPDAYLVEALCHAEMGEDERAADALARVPKEHLALPRVRMARAEIAYRLRDFDAARDEAEALIAAGVRLPDWLEAFRRPAVPAAPAQEVRR